MTDTATPTGAHATHQTQCASCGADWWLNSQDPVSWACPACDWRFPVQPKCPHCEHDAEYEASYALDCTNCKKSFILEIKWYGPPPSTPGGS